MRQLVQVAVRPGFGRCTVHLRRTRRFLRSPKGYLTLALAVHLALSVWGAGFEDRSAVLAGALCGAVGTDLLMQRLVRAVPRMPASALLTGLLIGLILAPQEGGLVACLAGSIGVAGKYLLRLKRLHIFNPAALGLLAVYVLYSTGQSWWGALPDMRAGVLVLIVTGYLVAGRANKLPAVLAFLFTYFSLFTIVALFFGQTSLAEVFRTPLVNTALFCAAFMVSDPPTSPVRYSEQLVYGLTIAAISFLTYMLTRGVYYPLVGLLGGNVLYACRRVTRTASHARRLYVATNHSASTAPNPEIAA